MHKLTGKSKRHHVVHVVLSLLGAGADVHIATSVSDVMLLMYEKNALQNNVMQSNYVKVI